MTYYIFIENGKTNGAGQAPQIDDGVINFEVTEQVFNAFIENPDKYIWNEDKQEIIENPNYEQEQLAKVKQEKYDEITEKYDYANKYLVLNVDSDLGLYANVAWYQTWTKVKSLIEQLMPQSENPSIPNAVRFYKITPKGKLYNKNIQNLDLAKFIQYYNTIQYAQFNILQPKRDNLYLQLAQASDITTIKAINVDFGITLNEQDINDVSLKVDLTYTDI